jgi:hypothetical protein
MIGALFSGRQFPKEVNMQRYALPRTFLAGFLFRTLSHCKDAFFPCFFLSHAFFFPTVQAQIPGITVDSPPLRNARMVGDNKTTPPGTYEVFGATTDAATLYAHDGRISRL